MRFWNEYDPRRFRDLRREMDRVFADLDRPRSTAFPPVNIHADENGLEVTAEIPGADPSVLEISALHDSLTIRGELPTMADEEGHTWHRRERRSGPFSRTIQLPYQIDAGSVDASCRDGVLRISLKRPEQDIPRRIEVKAS